MIQIVESKMPIKWVHLKDYSNAEQKWMYKNKDVQEMILDIQEVIEHSDDLMFKSSSDKDCKKNRMNNIKYHLEDDGWLDLPLIGVTIKNGQPTISFTNGRHRTIFAYENGWKKMPFLVYVDKEDEHYQEIMEFIKELK